jgi:hypothetical protein
MSLRGSGWLVVVMVVLMAGAVGVAQEAKKAAATQPSAGVTGTYSWTFEGPQGDMEFTFKLKQDGDKVTGTVSGFGAESEIQKGTVSKTGEIVFEVSRDFGGRPMVTTYRGKVVDGVFKGTSQMVMTRDFEAKRVKE